MNGHNSDENKNTDFNAQPQNGTGTQGIFSTPDLTVDTEKITPKTNSDDKNRVAAFFADTDASKQKQQVQNAMVVSNPATEDIVINDGEKKKRSKLPIIAAIVTVLVVVGGLATFALLQNQPKNPKEVLSATDIVSFATYALSENAREVLDNGYIGTRSYRLEQQIRLTQSGRDTAEYFDSLNKTFETVYNDAKNSFTSETNYTDKDLISMRERLEVINQFISGQKLTSSDLVSLYLAQGGDVMQQVANSEANKYDALENNTIAKEYAATIRETAMMVKINYDTYTKYGCIQDGIRDTECASLIPEDEIEILDLSDDRILNFIYSAAKQVEQDTFTIYWSTK